MIPRLEQNRLFDARRDFLPPGELVFEHRERQKNALAIVFRAGLLRAFAQRHERRLTLRDLLRDSVPQAFQ